MNKNIERVNKNMDKDTKKILKLFIMIIAFMWFIVYLSNYSQITLTGIRATRTGYEIGYNEGVDFGIQICEQKELIK